MSSQVSPGISKSAMTWLSLWTVYLIWGSTYFAIANVIESMPPLLAMGIRFLIAGLLLALLISLRQGVGELKIPKEELRSSLVMGFLLLGFGLGTVSIAQAYVPSGIAALIIAALPLWIAIFRTISGERLARVSWLGLVIGFAGMALLLKPGSITPVSDIEDSKLFLFMLLVLLGNIGWALGTFLAPRFPLPKDTLVFTAYEMLAGGVSLTLGGFIKGESISDFLDATSWSWLWFFYLVIFGSIAAYSAYLWLVANAPVSLTATYAYVNPIIAVALGVIFLDELITSAYASGAAIVLVGVILVVSAERVKKEPAI
ncbi:MAG: EamA family transporter [Actinobacteria bacterium]|nr:EamA family transporter [Actinomycetota bacterium]